MRPISVPPIDGIERGERDPKIFFFAPKTSRKRAGQVAVLGHGIRVAPSQCFEAVTERLVREGVTVVWTQLSGHAKRRLPEGADQFSINDHILDWYEIYTALLAKGMDPRKMLLHGHSYSANVVARHVGNLLAKGKPRPRALMLQAPALYPDKDLRGTEGQLLHINGQPVRTGKLANDGRGRYIEPEQWARITSDWSNQPRSRFNRKDFRLFCELPHEAKRSRALMAIARYTSADQGGRLIMATHQRDEAITPNVAHSYTNAAVTKRCETFEFRGLSHFPEQSQWKDLAPRMSQIILNALASTPSVDLTTEQRLKVAL